MWNSQSFFYSILQTRSYFKKLHKKAYDVRIQDRSGNWITEQVAIERLRLYYENVQFLEAMNMKRHENRDIIFFLSSPWWNSYKIQWEGGYDISSNFTNIESYIFLKFYNFLTVFNLSGGQLESKPSFPRFFNGAPIWPRV